MADPLEKIVRELRSETCPDSVLIGVADRVARLRTRAHPSRRRFLRGLIGAFAGILALGAVVIWNQPARRSSSLEAKAEARKAPAVVVQEAVGSLALVGHSLNRVASHAEDALIEAAAPPLLKSFRNAKTKLTNNL